MAQLIEGLVVSHLGKGIAVESAGKIILCQTRRRLDTAAVGDRVLWQLSAPDQGRIEEILPRRSLLTRPSRNDKVTCMIYTTYDVIGSVLALGLPSNPLLG